jgi:hypothetical protein
MAHKSRADRLARLERLLLSPERYVGALLEVRTHDDQVLFRTGGTWDRTARRYVQRTATPRIVRLQESQADAGRSIARWLDACRRGDPQRPVVIMFAGARGSGKTWLLGLALVAIGLEWPGDVQFCVNLTTPQRREVIEAMEEVAAPTWLGERSDDLRDPWTRLTTGSTVYWLSSRNPKRLRQAKLRIRAVHINEGQDQPEGVYVNAISATRNVDGVTLIATNPPQQEGGNWVATLANAIDAKELDGEWYQLDPGLNRAVDTTALEKRARALRAVSQAAADADAGGIMQLAGPMAYPAFVATPYNSAEPSAGGHIAELGELLALGWQDVTRELTGTVLGSGDGCDYVVGVDFQRRPGIAGPVGRLFRDPAGLIYLWLYDYVTCPGTEAAFSQALISAGYTTNGFQLDGQRGPSVLLIGDGTAARQNAEHNFSQPPSFFAMRSDGWLIEPPMYHWRTHVPWNPGVKESRSQMHTLLTGRRVLFSPRCREPQPGFPSLIDSLRRAKVYASGSLVAKGGFQHGPDGVRYLAWRFLPRPRPPQVDTAVDVETMKALAGVRILSS